MRDKDYRRDLEALRAASRRELPTRADSSRALQAMLEDRADRRGGLLMTTLGKTHRRRWVSTTLAAVAAIIALFFIPVSYDVVVGHEVSLDLHGASLDQVQAQSLATELGAAVGSDDTSVRHVMFSGPSNGSRYTVSARVKDRTRGRVEQIAADFAAGLMQRGVQTNTSVRQLIERVTGSVCTAAASSVAEIWIDTEGRSPDEIAEDIQTQLSDAGLDDANVAVDMENGCCQISIQVPESHEGDLPEIRCRDAEGDACQTMPIEVHRTPEMSDEDIIAEIERQLAEQGLSGTVTIDSEGQVRVEMSGGCQ